MVAGGVGFTTMGKVRVHPEDLSVGYTRKAWGVVANRIGLVSQSNPGFSGT